MSLGCGPVAANGTEEQKLGFLTPMAKGDVLGAFGLTEPGRPVRRRGYAHARHEGGRRLVGDGRQDLHIKNGSVAK